MGAELFDSRPDLLVDTAESVLGWSLREVCLNGPLEILTRTDRAQPALYALAYVLWSEFIAQVDAGPAAAAGHSLGEYTGLRGIWGVLLRRGLAAGGSEGLCDVGRRRSSVLRYGGVAGGR